MPTQVRIFTMPRSLDETLAEPVSLSTAPRSIPDKPDFWKNVEPPRPKYKPVARQTMAVYNNLEAPAGNGGITFAHQDSLPKLPIPELDGTLQRYLASLRPLQTAREHGETKHAVNEFLKQDGPDLNERLKKYAAGKTSYIEQFCKLLPGTPSYIISSLFCLSCSTCAN
jgi:carnitine O-acetyltransferase